MSADHKEPFRDYDHEDSNIDNEFEPFVLVDSKDCAFDDYLSTSSCLERLIATISNEIGYKLDGILTSASKETPSLNSEKSFATPN